MKTKDNFLIPVGRSPVPIARVINAIHDVFNPILVYTNETKVVAQRIVKFFEDKDYSIDLYCSDGISLTSDNSSCDKKLFNETSEGNFQILMGPSIKWLCALLALKNRLQNIWIIAEKKSKGKINTQLPLLRNLNSELSYKLDLLADNEIYFLNGIKLKEDKIYSLSTNFFTHLEAKISLDTNSNKIIILFSPPDGHNGWSIDSFIANIRLWENSIVEKRSSLLYEFGEHMFIFTLPLIICKNKKQKGKWESQFTRIKNSGNWRGGDVVCK